MKDAFYDEADKTNKSKNSYELLFKLSTKRVYPSSRIMFRQAIFVKSLFIRVLRSFDDYFSSLKAIKSKSQNNIPKSNEK